ncbi:MAG TPA: glycoside hydrolase family 3 N-terminal domain-containing protein [Propionibacteriaceae bacterium]|nr:glycoside hydrolase family 3 N-terminal domain-containing protein [Propionibacteriaceae bacterium]
MSLREQVGQLMMVGVNSGGLGSAEGRTLARTRAGSVILLGNSTLGAGPTRRVVRDVRDATRRPEGIKTLLAVDQEGGQVQRLTGRGFDPIPSAQSQAEQSDPKLTANAARWGRQLAAVGIDANLAPVADVVPADLGTANAPVGLLRRGYGSSPRTVSAKTTAFVNGMDRGGIATAVKHFPGLGRVRGNTDFVRRVVDDQTTRRDPGLAGFAATIDAGVDMVMVSSAYYTKIDADHRAAFSTVVIGSMLRRDLKFHRVVISDDLAAAAMADLAPGTRARRFVRAGGDLLIVGDPTQADAMADALHQAARDDSGVARRVAESATRVVSLKADRGLAACAR